MSEAGTVDPRIRPLARDELDLVVGWAAAEGWNPGLADAACFWATDPEAFVGADVDGELAASASLVSYGRRFGFIGLFIVRPELRGAGLGRALWRRLCDRLSQRLHPGAPMGLDGVFAMQDFYAEAGFRLSHRNLRMRGVGEASAKDVGLVPLSELPFAGVAAFDRLHFGFSRDKFLRTWISPSGGLGLGLIEDGRLRGIGVARPCLDGYKIGPLFAADGTCAERLFSGLGTVADGEPVFLDVPEINTAAMALAERHGMEEVFGCARMYVGSPPALPRTQTFGVTTFELG